MNTKNILLKSYLLIASCALFNTAYAVSFYDITDLGALNISDTEAQNLKIKINDKGDVIGWSHRGASLNNAIAGFHNDAQNKITQPLSLTANHKFHGINAAQQVVGYVENNNIATATLWSKNFTASETLGTLVGGTWSIAYAINNKGDVVGQSENANKLTQAVVWSSGVVKAVISDSTLASYSADINQKGWIVGDVFPKGKNSQAFVFDGNTVTQLDATDSNVKQSWVAAINDLDQVIGGMMFSTDVTDNPRYFRNYAFSWNKTDGLTKLGENINVPSWANAINNSGQIVGGMLKALPLASQVGNQGGYNNPSTSRQAILWEGGVAYNLNDLVQNNQSWILQNATGINDSGTIVGIGSYLSSAHVFLLKPAVSGVASADLSINIVKLTKSNKPNARSLVVDSVQQISLEIINEGPSVANNVVIETKTSLPLTQSDIVSSQAVCNVSDGVIRCEVDQLMAAASTSVTIDLSSIPVGEFDISSTVSANETDAGPNDNNIASEKLVISKPEVVTILPVDISPVDSSSGSPVDDNSSDPADNRSDKPLIQAANKNASGCTLSDSKTVDPTFWILCIVAFSWLLTRKHTSR